MANYSPQDALTLNLRFIRNMTIDSTSQAIMCDQTMNIIHCAYPWRWTLATLTAISLVDGTQDYSVANTDVYRFTNLRITRTDLSPNQSQPLDIVEHLEPDLYARGGNYNIFRAASWEANLSKLRLDVCAKIVSPVTMQIDGTYQKNPTKITAAGITTALTQPDQYFPVFQEGVLYQLYKYADDDRAGSIVRMKDGATQYTGQLGVFMARLWEMQQAEDYGNNQGVRFPEEGLGGVRGLQNPGLFIY